MRNFTEAMENFRWQAIELSLRFFGDPALTHFCQPYDQNEFGTSQIIQDAELLVETLKTLLRK